MSDGHSVVAVERGIGMVVRALVVTFALALTAIQTGVASAHGERAQEGFLRMKTVAREDMKLPSKEVNQGGQLVITGRVKVLESWPKTLPDPVQAFLNVTSSGPHFVMKERYINGQPAPASFFVEVGGVYDFKMILEGRTPGSWHVHPTFYVLHSGGLIGPGQWTTAAAAPGGYQNKVMLHDGKDVDLGRYVFAWVFWFSFVGFIPGVWWMLWWTLKHRTVTNLAVTSQIPVNDPGEDIGLITKADHRMSTAIAVVSLLILGVGWLYMEWNWPVRIPQQVLRFTPPQPPEPPKFALARGLRATYDPREDRVIFESEVTNKGNQPMKVLAFTTSTLTFNQGTGLVAEPATIEPGKTVTVKGTIQDKAWSQERLIPLDKPQMGIAGLLIFEADGKQSAATIEAPVRPTSFVGK